jgi:uncharacterized protein YoxC
MLSDDQAMEIELELETKMKDVSEVIEKLSPVLKSVKDLGFVVKELEIESHDDEDDDDEDKSSH